MIRLLLESGADANAPDGAGETPLMAAAAGRQPRRVKALLAAGAALDAQDKTFQQTALMVAVRANHPPARRLFLEQGADVNAQTRTGETPRWVLPNSVPGFGHGIGIVRGGLPERGSRYLIPGAMTPLLYAARDGRLESATLLLDARRQHRAGRRQRHHAAAHGHRQQPSGRGAAAHRARRQRQRGGLVRAHAAVGGGRGPQHGRRQRHVRQQRGPRAAARPDQGAARQGRRRQRAHEGVAADPPADAARPPARWRGWTSPARRRSSARRSPPTSR